MQECLTSFPWKEEYRVNVGIVDLQHRRLVGLINDLEQAMRNGGGQRMLKFVFDELVDYMRVHFATEEEALEACGYPLREAHTSEHMRLTLQVEKFQREFHAGDAPLSVDVLDFLYRWLAEHIVGSDRQFGPYLNAHGVP